LVRPLFPPFAAPLLPVHAAPAASGGGAAASGTVCRCAKSRCLMRYCECFSVGATCGPRCGCTGCANFVGSGELQKRLSDGAAGSSGKQHAQQAQAQAALQQAPPRLASASGASLVPLVQLAPLPLGGLPAGSAPPRPLVQVTGALLPLQLTPAGTSARAGALVWQLPSLPAAPPSAVALPSPPTGSSPSAAAAAAATARESGRG
jgi:hypothetical protein